MSLTGRQSDRSPSFHYITDIVHHVSSPNVYRRPGGVTVEQFCDFLVEELERKILEIALRSSSSCRSSATCAAGTS